MKTSNGLGGLLIVYFGPKSVEPARIGRPRSPNRRPQSLKINLIPQGVPRFVKVNLDSLKVDFGSFKVELGSLIVGLESLKVDLESFKVEIGPLNGRIRYQRSF